MLIEIAQPAAEQGIRWMEDSPKVFEGVRQLLAACDQAMEAAARFPLAPPPA